MHNLLNVQFGYSSSNGNPAIYVFGYPIYLYALIIVSGMCIAMLIGAYFFKKRGIDPYDMSIYAIVMLPLGILGARAYVFIFPWAGQEADWSQFFTGFRDGGLGIYGGVVIGYLSVLVMSKIRKQRFDIIADCIMPGLFIAQSIGRWGNFVNQEAYGSIITNPAFQWFPFAVQIGQHWHQATFFYESIGTFIGFVVCLLLLRCKHYRIGWLTAFYGIYYGLVRLFVEGLRTDSLFLWIGDVQTDIRISQLVSIFTILLGLRILTVLYRKQLHELYSRWFISERDEVAKSRYILGVLIFVMLSVAVVMFTLGGESKFIAGAVLVLLSIYSTLGIASLNDRLKLYCPKCGMRSEPQCGTYNHVDITAIRLVIFKVLLAILLIAGITLICLGLYVTGVVNHIVLGIIALVCSAAVLWGIISATNSIKNSGISPNVKANVGAIYCVCGEKYTVTLNKFLLAIFQYKQYMDYSTKDLVEWVDPDKVNKESSK